MGVNRQSQSNSDQFFPELLFPNFRMGPTDVHVTEKSGNVEEPPLKTFCAVLSARQQTAITRKRHVCQQQRTVANSGLMNGIPEHHFLLRPLVVTENK
jgi:hypothetical protein